MSAWAMEIRGLRVAYGRHAVLAGVDLAVPRTGVTAIVGPSGCGKSTMLMTVSRLNEGSRDVHVEGDIVTHVERIGIVFQRPFPFKLSIFENIALGLRESGCPAGELSDRVEEALTQAGLWNEVKERLRQSAFHLSGGQQQRMCIARSLALKPELLLLDEPCSSLDPLSTKAIESTLLKLSEEIPIVIVTHSLGQAKRLSRHLGVLWNLGEGGRILEQGSTEDLFHSAKQPFVREFLNGMMG